jgi:hypothetical protein
MGPFYQYDKYQEELAYDDFTLGQQFPAFRYQVTLAHVEAYHAAVKNGIRGKIAPDLMRHPLFPTLVSLSYGFVYSAIGGRLPQGFLNSAVDINLIAPAPIGQDLSMSVTVDDKQIKRERQHLTLAASVTDASGSPIAAVRIGCVIP